MTLRTLELDSHELNQEMVESKLSFNENAFDSFIVRLIQILSFANRTPFRNILRDNIDKLRGENIVVKSTLKSYLVSQRSL